MHQPATDALINRISGMTYDAVILSGDYRVRTFGDIDVSMAGMRALRDELNQPIYAVLGNHDTIRMVPELESSGYQDITQRIGGIDTGRSDHSSGRC